MLSDVGRRGVASVLDIQPFFFLLKKIGFAPRPDNNAEPNINILLTRNFPFDSNATQ